jgi:hypothetical protein
MGKPTIGKCETCGAELYRTSRDYITCPKGCGGLIRARIGPDADPTRHRVQRSSPLRPRSRQGPGSALPLEGTPPRGSEGVCPCLDLHEETGRS